MKTALTGPVRVRFAPSPTGFLHVGGARTAIYNDLLRQSLGGSFILRIEDTDRARSDQAMIEQIRSALAWVGVPWDEGPFLQSDGVERHRQAAHQLIAAGHAYPCTVSPELLEEKRKEAQKRGEELRYRDVFARPTAAQVEQMLAAGEPYAIRFKSGDGDVRFHDLVRGEVTFPAATLDDFIILRSDGSPTYHLSVVCDDVEMRITHVIRGEDHISNTPKHVELFRAFGAEPPVFGHLPLILGPDRKRLSKRTGAASVEEFREQGMLPAAVYNYLVLLGWSPGEDREVMTREEMIELFTVERLNASAAVFDPEKLRWMNAQYLMHSELADLLPHLEPFLAPLGLGGLEGAGRDRLLATLALHRTRARTLQELVPQLVPYFRERLSYDADACAKFLDQPHLPAHLQQLAAAYGRLEPFTADALEAELRRLATELGLKAGDLIHPTRMALSGEQKGPPLFDLVVVMGREATLRHLGNFATFLQESAMEAGTLL